MRLVFFYLLLLFLSYLNRRVLSWSYCLLSEHIFLCFFYISPGFIFIVLIFIIYDFLFLSFFLLVLICVWIGSAVTALNNFSWGADGCYLLNIRLILLNIIFFNVLTWIRSGHIKLKNILSCILFFHVLLISEIKFKSCVCSIHIFQK